MFEDIGILIIAVVAVLSVVLAYWVIRQTRIDNKKSRQLASKIAEGQLLLDMLREYSSDSMLEAIQTLRNWHKEYKELYKKEFSEKYRIKDLSVIPINRARYLVLNYFVRMLKLYNNQYVSEDFCNIICSSNDAEVLFQVVQPFEEIVSEIDQTKAYNKETFENLRKFFPKKDNYMS